VGRALAPVEAIRLTVADISATDLDRRVPEPSGGDEIARLARTMNAMLARVDAAGRRQRAFVADASHELRTPLASVQAQLDVGLVRPDETDWFALASQLRSDTARVQQLADNLLFLAVADDAKSMAERKPVDLDEIVLRAVEPARFRGRVRIDLTGVGAARVIGDESQLGRMVTNLIDNAERHATSIVAVELRQTAEFVTLAVIDDGPGIAAEDRTRVFERFTRLDAARQRTDGGAGLGLSIVRDIVDAHGGMVMFANVAVGAKAVVTIPSPINGARSTRA
jgi:signal transduction histidine kinase